MRVISARNVHHALSLALNVMDEEGVRRDSRNGPVIQAPWPVTTTYMYPWERVIFWKERDANPFLHLYEGLWMLAGRNDVAPLVRYAKQYQEYSDDGEILWDAYGSRWRNFMDCNNVPDQLAVIIERLRQNPEDRRSVLQMWSSQRDLNRNKRSVPCNLTATFQRGPEGKLDMVVFCRSNDIVWGCYGANAVTFSMLQEYLADRIGCGVGNYAHVSVNWHMYADWAVKLSDLPRASVFSQRHVAASQGGLLSTPYSHEVEVLPMAGITDAGIHNLLRWVDGGCVLAPHREDSNFPWPEKHSFLQMAAIVLRAHEVWRTLENPGETRHGNPDRFTHSLNLLKTNGFHNVDWVVAAREWIERRQYRWEKKQEKQNVGY